MLKRRFTQGRDYGRRPESVGGQGSSNLKGGNPPAATVSAHIPMEKRAKLSFKEARELDTLPARMAALEAEQKTLEQKLADPATYADAAAAADAAKLKARFEAIEEELMLALERWDVLEKMRA